MEVAKRLRDEAHGGLADVEEDRDKQDGPLTATAVAKGLGGRSAGAVSNCLARLAKAKKVRLAKKAPRAYVAKAARAR